MMGLAAKFFARCGEMPDAITRIGNRWGWPAVSQCLFQAREAVVVSVREGDVAGAQNG